ncbi:MAG TPA: hypothetical protein VEJ86_12410 [Candidatus Binataceae bacterium]|nr:hypothetical protein [Candidatus Binataceae bacterium]
MSDDLQLRITGIEAGEELDGARRLLIKTTRGPIRLLMHGTAGVTRAVLCVSGAIGGFNGPARLYERLGRELPVTGTAVARLDYRAPNEFGECLVDTLAGLSVLRGTGHHSTALIGHSFGGAVAINAGTLAPQVATVIAISSQLAGAHVVADLAPRPLLLIHGTADLVLSHESSQAIFDRAREPRRLELIPEADHGYSAHAERLFELVAEWLAATL